MFVTNKVCGSPIDIGLHLYTECQGQIVLLTFRVLTSYSSFWKKAYFYALNLCILQMVVLSNLLHLICVQLCFVIAP